VPEKDQDININVMECIMNEKEKSKQALKAQYTYSITVFVVNYREYFTENSELYDIKPRNNKNLFRPQSNLCVSQRGPHYADIKIYNNLPIQINLLPSNFNQFKKSS